MIQGKSQDIDLKIQVGFVPELSRQTFSVFPWIITFIIRTLCDKLHILGNKRPLVFTKTDVRVSHWNTATAFLYSLGSSFEVMVLGRCVLSVLKYNFMPNVCKHVEPGL